MKPSTNITIVARKTSEVSCKAPSPLLGVRRLVAAFAFAPRSYDSHQVLTVNSGNPPSHHNSGREQGFIPALAV